MIAKTGKKITTRKVNRGIFVFFFLCIFTSAQAVAKAPYFDFNVAPGLSVDKALNLIAAQAKSPLLIPYEQVRTIKAEGVSGRYTIEQALAQVLRGTGFKAEVNAHGVITVRAVSKPVTKENSNSLGVPEHNDAVLEEVVVSGIGGFRKSLLSATEIKRNTESISSSLSASEIGQLPSITIADSLELVPGVAADKNRGISSQISLRGLGPQLTAATLNGREQATSSPSRNIRFSQYPAELISAVTVYKSSPADSLEGGVSGTIELQTVKPLDYSEELTLINLRQTYDELAESSAESDAYGSRAVFFHIDQFFKDTLGIAFGVSGLDAPIASARTSNGLPVELDQDYDDNGILELGFPNTAYQLSFEKQRRGGAVLSTQWRPTDAWNWDFSLFYSRLTENKHREQLRYQYLFGLAPALSNLSIDNDRVRAFDFDANNENRIDTATILVDRSDKLYDLGLNGSWHNSVWRLAGDVAVSKAMQDRSLTNLFFQKNNIGALRFRAPFGEPSSVYPIEANQLSSFEGFIHQRADFGVLDIQDQISALRFDAERDAYLALPADISLQSIAFGLRYVEREKKYHEQHRINMHIAGQAVDENLAGNFFFDDLTVFDIANEARVPWATFDAQGVIAAYGTRDFSSPNDADLLDFWEVEEDRLSAYIKTNFEGNLMETPFIGDLGFRIVRGQILSSSYIEVLEGNEGNLSIGGVRPIDVSSEFTDFLPNANITFELNNDLFLRFGAAKLVALPPPNLLTPSRDLTLSTQQPRLRGVGGNPTLDPFRANHFDMSVEWYIDNESGIFASVYYKDIESFIVSGEENEIIDGVDFIIRKPINDTGGVVRGLEFTYQQAFTFLPTPFDGAGVMLNFNYADSSARAFSTRDENVEIDVAGFSERVSSAVLYYSKNNTNFRLQYIFRSPFTTPDQRVFADDSRLSISAGYKFNKTFRVYFDGANLLEEMDYAEFPESNELSRIDYIGRRYSVGIEISF